MFVTFSALSITPPYLPSATWPSISSHIFSYLSLLTDSAPSSKRILLRRVVSISKIHHRCHPHKIYALWTIIHALGQNYKGTIFISYNSKCHTTQSSYIAWLNLPTSLVVPNSHNLASQTRMSHLGGSRLIACIANLQLYNACLYCCPNPPPDTVALVCHLWRHPPCFLIP